jgi:hypothetical protein
MKKRLCYYIVTFLLLLPAIIHAQVEIDWNFTEWRAYSGGEINDNAGTWINDWDEDINYTEPLVSSQVSVVHPWEYQWATSQAEINTDYGYGYISASANNYLSDPDSYALAFAGVDFYGTFTAQYPLLVFNYDVSYDIYAEGRDDTAGAYNDVGLDIWVGINDFAECLYCPEMPLVYGEVGVTGVETDSSSDSFSGTLTVGVPVGEEIEVWIDGWEYADVYGDATAGASSLTASVGIVAAPEPVSSVLFVIGGAVLGFRRFRKNN